MKLIYIVFIIIFLSNCTTFTNFDGPPEEEKGAPGLFSKDSKKGISLQEFFEKKKDAGTNFYVNAYLWRASLEVSSFAPLISTDAFGGTILTDWFLDPKTKQKRIKLAVFIKTQELRSEGISVKVYIQNLIDNKWSEVSEDKKLGSQIEDIILTKARELRITSRKE